MKPENNVIIRFGDFQIDLIVNDNGNLLMTVEKIEGAQSEDNPCVDIIVNKDDLSVCSH
jgi:hypothetical protein